MELIRNLINNYNYLQLDYIGSHPDVSFISNLIINVTISLGLITIFYLLGSKIKNILLSKNSFHEQEIFIKIALGYIFVGTGLATFGLFSLLYPTIITLYLILVILLSFFPLRLLKKNIKELNKFKKLLFNDFKIHRWVFIWITLFIFIGILRLQSPEIREDQYHTDLPVQYLKNHTIMLPSREQIMVSQSPQLAEMSYLISIFLGSKETARYIHFIFYILVLSLLYSLSKEKKYKFVIIAPLLLATTPEVIRETSSQYTDFQWIFLFLLSTIILVKNKSLSVKLIALSGFIFGGMIATKLWTIAFIVVPLFYIAVGSLKNRFKIINHILIYVFGLVITPSIWFLRSFILTGNPIYPALMKRDLLESTVNLGLFNYLTLNSSLLSLNNLKIFSPLFFLGIIFFIYKFKETILILTKVRIFLFFITLTILYIFINYPYGRYLLGLYSIAIIIFSLPLYKIVYKNRFIKYAISIILLFMLTYYLISSLLILPYGIGLADKNKYLTRTLSRDNSSYYDFDHKFNGFIKKNDLVATYGIFGHYYADFNYIDVNNIFDKNSISISLLKAKRVTKLFIKNGDINWFCDKLGITDCEPRRYNLLSYYSAVPYSGSSYYLYELK
ncbi:MAG: hypothetical protein M1372_01025 [Patescibacteria group bacterium]|nr:hypothetical protein [Patescibacteria group bacterium]